MQNTAAPDVGVVFGGLRDKAKSVWDTTFILRVSTTARDKSGQANSSGSRAVGQRDSSGQRHQGFHQYFVRMRSAGSRALGGPGSVGQSFGG